MKNLKQFKNRVSVLLNSLQLIDYTLINELDMFWFLQVAQSDNHYSFKLDLYFIDDIVKHLSSNEDLIKKTNLLFFRVTQYFYKQQKIF